jgi:hypothetical protein
LCTNTDTYFHGDAHSHGDLHTYGYSDRHPHSDGDANGYGYVHADCHSDVDSDAHIYSEVYSDAAASPYPATAPVTRDSVIRVYNAAGNLIETHEHKGHLKEW